MKNRHLGTYVKQAHKQHSKMQTLKMEVVGDHRQRCSQVTVQEQLWGMAALSPVMFVQGRLELPLMRQGQGR